MSGAARCLSRLTLQHSRQTIAKRKQRCPDWRTPLNQFRSFSSVPSWLAEENDASSNLATETEKRKVFDPASAKEYLTIEDLEDDSRAEFDRSTPEEQNEWREALRSLSETDPTTSFVDELNGMDEEIAKEVEDIDRTAPVTFPEKKPNKLTAGFWADEEDDEFGQVFDDDDEFREDDMTTPAHAQLDLHRDMRAYQRRIAWDMPLLSKFAKAFSPPPLTSPLRFRYTTYMGEQHPSSRKVVVQICPSDLPSLTNPQRNKLIKLSGVRYNPDTDVIKMSCEKFETQAQNKRYLGDLINNLIAEATDPKKDSFEDVPFDFRHHKPKKVVDFPEGWKLGKQEKVRELVEGRERRALLEEGRREVNGDAVVRQYVEAVAAFQARRPNPALVGGAPTRGGRQIAR